jgi:hypothetical protein
MACLWPGLPQLWTYGSWSGLGVALGMAIAFDGVLAATFGWNELIGGNVRTALWAVFGVVWAVGVVWSVKTARQWIVRAANLPEDAFSEALTYYLKGDYFQSEDILQVLWRHNARDLEPRLMLGTLLRRTGRCDEAVGQLDALARFEGASRWEWEMRKERELLAEARVRQATAA